METFEPPSFSMHMHEKAELGMVSVRQRTETGLFHPCPTMLASAASLPRWWVGLENVHGIHVLQFPGETVSLEASPHFHSAGVTVKFDKRLSHPSQQFPRQQRFGENDTRPRLPSLLFPHCPDTL